jgi:protein CpxP
MNRMKANKIFRLYVVFAGLFFGLVFHAPAQIGAELQMAELSKKLELTDQQKKDLTPIVEQRDKQAKALKADTSMGKLQKLHKAMEIQANFKEKAAKYLNADQVKKLEALQAERRAKLMGH